MAKQGGPVFFNQTIGNFCLYFRCGVPLARWKSSLDGKRWKTDPAFTASRKSAADFAMAVHIATPLYRSLPVAKRQVSQFRQLIGACKKMLMLNTPIHLVYSEMNRVTQTIKESLAAPAKPKKQSRLASEPACFQLPAPQKHSRSTAITCRRKPRPNYLSPETASI